MNVRLHRSTAGISPRLTGVSLALLLCFGAGTLLAQSPEETAASKVAQAAEAQQRGWMVSARKLLEEAAAIDPDTPGLKFRRAFQELREGHPRRAAAFARASLVAGQEIADCRTLLGLLAVQEKNYTEAEQHMRDAVAADPESSRGYYNLSEVLRWQGRPREALEQLEIAQKKQPDDPVLPLKIRLTTIEIGERLTFIRPKSSAEDAYISDPAWALTEAALALRGGKIDKAAALLEEAEAGLQPQFFYPLLKEDHFFQTYKLEPGLERFFK